MAPCGAGAVGGGLGHGQTHGSQDGRMPGAEILCRVITLGYVPQVIVDVRRRGIMPARPGPVGQQLIPASAPSQQAPHDGADQILCHGLLAELGALGGVLEHELAPS